MIRIRIDKREEDLSSVNESWINQQIDGRRADGYKPCVQVTIREDHVNIMLSTPDCPGAGAGRRPNEYEKRILDLWEKLGLNKKDFSGGNLIAFLKQIQR